MIKITEEERKIFAEKYQQKIRRKFLPYFVGKAFEYMKNYMKHSDLNNLSLEELRSFLDSFCPECELSFLEYKHYSGLYQIEADRGYCFSTHLQENGDSSLAIKDQEILNLIENFIDYIKNKDKYDEFDK